jgi:hypothetical protein
MAAPPLLQVKTKPKCSKNATATRTKKEMTVVVYATTVLGFTSLVFIYPLKKIIIGYCIDTMPCRVCVFKWIVIHINIQIQAINRTC